MSTFKDLFSRQSVDYAKFRPTYPPELFQYLSTLTLRKDCAWDCGTGNGQAAKELASYFSRVIATDPSEKQIQSAFKKAHVEYRLATAEDSGLPDKSVDLITVAQAFHWFNQERFFREVERVIKKPGVLAIWSYGLAKVNPKVDPVYLKLYEDILGSYWEQERKMVEDGYAEVQFPYEELVVPKFRIQKAWNLDHFIGYLHTWSAVQKYMEKNNGKNPLEIVADQFVKSWGLKDVHIVTWDITLRAFRI